MEAQEVIDLFSRMTLHQQAALMRLTSRNLMIDLNGEFHMGYDFDWNVHGAMIIAAPAKAEDFTVTPEQQSLLSSDDA